MKIRHWIAILIIILIIPSIIDWLIIGNNLPSNITNDLWINFLGSYIGGLFGGIATLFAFIKNIEYNKDKDHEQQKKYENDKRLSLQPYILVSIVSGTSNINRKIKATEIEGKTARVTLMGRFLEIKNIGLGSLVDLKFNSSDLKIIEKNFKFPHGLSKGQEFIFILDIIKEQTMERIFTIVVTYNDMLGNKYKQTIELCANAKNNFMDILNISRPELY
ncbi:hypothetical protein [Caloranaerobacter ferrireducens]|uniref:hypothetical protein n=1 Tax=Caloranaerobacter ferrireducens TaxID=1323370 RepID=UPI00084CEFA5|nr:hypothetical protein [Caloranaerobacter ferrireducens]